MIKHEIFSNWPIISLNMNPIVGVPDARKAITGL